jgi:hypothetical protein
MDRIAPVQSRACFSALWSEQNQVKPEVQAWQALPAFDASEALRRFLAVER